MFTARHILTIITPEGHATTHLCYRIYLSEKRVTWINLDGTRGYVLLRHGFTYYNNNA